MPFARVRDIDVYYEIHGVGPRLLHISGTNSDLRYSADLGTSPLATSFETLYYDQRGLGRTTIPAGPYSMADYADDAAALMDAVGWDRAHVVGVSFGGMVAQHLAVRHPERVDRLVLACTSSGGAGGSSFDLLSLEGLGPDERARVAMPILDTRNDWTTEPPTVAPGLEQLLATMANRPPQTGNAARGAHEQLVARARHDAWDRLTEITAPTLIIGGRYDRQAAPENLERLAARIPGAALVLCDGGHVFMMQDPTAFPTIIEFLRRDR